MAGLLYYLPERQAATLEELRTGELGYAFEPQSKIANRAVQGGPAEGSGLVVADGRFLPAPRVGYYPDQQTWASIPGSTAWVGMYSDDRPTPPELARAEMLLGHSLVLGDDQEWLIPVARGWAEDDESPGYYQALPAAATLDEAGNWTRGAVMQRYAPLWDLALRWWDAFVAAVGQQAEKADAEETVTVTFDFAGQADGAVLALAANYRIGKTEVALLGLLTEMNMREILDCLIDKPCLERWLKKKADSMPAG